MSRINYSHLEARVELRARLIPSTAYQRAWRQVCGSVSIGGDARGIRVAHDISHSASSSLSNSLRINRRKHLVDNSETPTTAITTSLKQTEGDSNVRARDQA